MIKKKPNNNVHNKASIDSLKLPEANALCAHVIAKPDIISKKVLKRG
jgi:hypothetical protein